MPNVHVMPYTEASTYHILWSDVVVVERAGARDRPRRASRTRRPPLRGPEA